MIKRMTWFVVVLALSGSVQSESLSILASRNLGGDVSRILGVGNIASTLKGNQVPSILIDLGGALSPGEQTFNHRRNGSLTVDLMNKAGYAAWFLAGRDLVWSNQLTRFLRRTDFPVLAANLHRPETGRHLFQVQPYTVIRSSSKRIGLIGLAERTDGVLASNPVSAAKYYATILDEISDLVIVVSSAGPEIDRAIVESVPAVDLVIGEGTENLVTHIDSTGWVIAIERLDGLCGIDLTIQDGVITDAATNAISIPQVTHEAIQQAFVGWTADLEGEPVSLGTVIGHSDGGFQAALTSPLGYLVADVMRKAAATDGALVRADHFPADFVTGDVTVYDLCRAYPLPFTTGVISLKGQELTRLLQLVDGNLRYIPSGISVVYSQDDAGLVEASIGGKPIDPRVDYTIALEMGALSGDLPSGIRARDTGEFVRDLLGKHVRTSESFKGVVDGRIQRR
jgi:2',3'-cyclic-nucleotide 2'-phosphodiesterase (5'-nucleotidase family)